MFQRQAGVGVVGGGGVYLLIHLDKHCSYCVILAVCPCCMEAPSVCWFGKLILLTDWIRIIHSEKLPVLFQRSSALHFGWTTFGGPHLSEMSNQKLKLGFKVLQSQQAAVCMDAKFSQEGND